MAASFKFGPPGIRTDGRAFRPHKPWQVNNGQETANRSVAPGPVTPHTDFKDAFKFKIGAPGGPLEPRMDFSVQPTPAAPTPSSESGAGRFAGIKSQGLQSVSDGGPLPVFGDVNDQGAEPAPMNIAQRWTRTGQQLAQTTPAPPVQNGWEAPTADTAEAIKRQYTPRPQFRSSATPSYVSNF